MSGRENEDFARTLPQLPKKVMSLRRQAGELIEEADFLESLLEKLDRSKLDSLALTSIPRVDAALRLSLEAGPQGRDKMQAFEKILGKIEFTEREIAGWTTGGFMLADLTSQDRIPTCLEFALLEAPPEPVLQIVADSSCFQDIPISVSVPARLLMAWNSNTSLVEYTDLLSEEEYNIGEKRLEIIEWKNHTDLPITTTFDLIKLFHPNRGTWRVPLAGIFLGRRAIEEHVAEWRNFVQASPFMGVSEASHYLEFLDEFLETIQDLAEGALIGSSL